MEQQWDILKQKYLCSAALRELEGRGMDLVIWDNNHAKLETSLQVSPWLHCSPCSIARGGGHCGLGLPRAQVQTNSESL